MPDSPHTSSEEAVPARRGWIIKRAVAASLLLIVAAVTVVLKAGGEPVALVGTIDAAASLQGAKAAGSLPSALPNAAPTESLHWGHAWFEKNGWTGHYRHSWNCGHYFRSLCNYHTAHPKEYYDTPWYNHNKWLDYSARLAQAHETDEQRETAFHEAVQELRAKVQEDRADREEAKKDSEDALKAEEEAVKARWQKEEDDSAATLLREKEEMEEQEARVNAEYLEKIANVSTGRSEYAKLMQEAEEADKARQAEYKRMINDMKKAGASDKDISGATQAFMTQEKVFHHQLALIKGQYKEQQSREEEDLLSAKKALYSYRDEMEENDARMDEQTHAKEMQQQQMEKQVQKAADKVLEARQSTNGKGAYNAAIKTADKEEDARQHAFEEDVEEQRKKQMVHDEALKKRAAAEQAKSRAEASKTTIANPQEQAVNTAALQSAAPGEGAGALESVHARAQSLALGPNGGMKKPEQGVKVQVKSKADLEEERRREAFFRAMAQKAAAEFKAMPTTA